MGEERTSATYLLLLVLVCSSRVVCEEKKPEDLTNLPQPEVVTPEGTYYGSTHYSPRRQNIYHAFTGIPYAKPPTGNLRFMPPEPADNVNFPFNATESSPQCIQWDHILERGVVGNEDCLYLNIYTNKIPSPPNYYNTQPIVVFLHAGTWSSGGGASDMFTPSYLLEMSVMVITINHRLGPFGFLTTADEEAPGNYGLLDQIKALEWIRINSRFFGGMNDSITVMGSGAGGISAHLLTLTPKSRGASSAADDYAALFHRAISQSGTAYSPDAIVRDPLEGTNKLAKKLGCKMTSSNSIISCLKMVPAQKIIQIMPTLYEWDEEPLLFGPVIDKKWMGKDAVLPDEPHHLIKHKEMLHVPWMVGTNKNDGAFKVLDILRDPALVSQLNNNWDKFGPLLLHLTKHSCKDPISIANQIRDFYMGKSKFSENSAAKFVEMMTDRFFLYPTEKASKEHSASLRKFGEYCYRYILTYCGKTSFLDLFEKVSPKRSVQNTLVRGVPMNPRFQNKGNDVHGMGVSFMDELLYLFPSPQLNFTYDLNYFGEDSAKVSSMMLMTWSNFMKGGDPTPVLPGQPEDMSPWGTWWEPFVKGTYYYMDIDPDMMSQEVPLKPKEMNFWADLPLFENVDQNVIRDEL